MILRHYTCGQCEKPFSRKSGNDSIFKNRSKSGKTFCSRMCCRKFYTKTQKVVCKQCSVEFIKKYTEIKKSLNHFCGRSCACTYSNAHKTKGTRISKLELYIQKQLNLIYPNLNFIFNGKKAINGELDIYIPSLKLAFELNGIFHYEPIFGEERLKQSQNNDQRKFQACIENDIELVIIDVSSQKYFKEKTSQKFLDIIIHIIDSKLK